MPIVYRCRSCGFVLYVFLRVGQDSYGVPTPSEVASWYGGVCPACGRPLGKPAPADIVVKPNGLQELQKTLGEARHHIAIIPLRLEVRRKHVHPRTS